MTFDIPFRLPGLNDYIAAMNVNKYKGNKLKRETQDSIILCLTGLRPVEQYPVEIFFEWREKTRRRDLDNIESAKKFILDALQEKGILKGDGQRYVCNIADDFIIPADYDGCTVTIEVA